MKLVVVSQTTALKVVHKIHFWCSCNIEKFNIIFIHLALKNSSECVQIFLCLSLHSLSPFLHASFLSQQFYWSVWFNELSHMKWVREWPLSGHCVYLFNNPKFLDTLKLFVCLFLGSEFGRWSLWLLLQRHWINFNQRSISTGVFLPFYFKKNYAINPMTFY